MTPYSEPRVERVNLFEREQGQQGQQATEQEDDIDELFVSAQEDMLGKRARADSHRKADRTLRPEANV